MHTSLSAYHRALLAAPDQPISPEAALDLLCLPSDTLLDVLALAQLARSHNKGHTAFTCGIINAKSGLCGEDCAFCAQSTRHKTDVAVYPLLPADTLVQRAETLAAAGVARFGIVTSGAALSARELDSLCQSAASIRARVDIGLCASLGQLTDAGARALKDAGFSRYHHNVETAASHFTTICTTHAYADDLETVRTAKRAGLQTCCGGLFGVGERPEQVIELALTLAELDVDAIPINFLTPIPGTPLEHTPLLSVQQALRIVAVMRLLHPRRDVLICGGREKVLGTLHSHVFAAGANGIMTGPYLTTTGCALEADATLMAMLGVC